MRIISVFNSKISLSSLYSKPDKKIKKHSIKSLIKCFYISFNFELIIYQVPFYLLIPIIFHNILFNFKYISINVSIYILLKRRNV